MAGELTPVNQVWPIVAGRVRQLGTTTLPLEKAASRVLRVSAVARWDLPMVDNSAMDGFAVRAADTQGEEKSPLKLVLEDAYAGTLNPPRVEPGTAVSIGTGGVVPGGADSVVPKENATWDETGVQVTVPAREGDHIRRRGEELKQGDEIIPAGERLTPLHLATMTMAGVEEVEVSRLPKVRVLSTGSELVKAGADARSGQVVDSNGPFLHRVLGGFLGQDPSQPQCVGDSEDELHTALEGLIDGADMAIVTGGVSVGDRDLVKPLLEESLGVQRIVWRVAQKPGKPFYLGVRDQTWVVGLPGNPGAVGAMWWVFVRPLLLALCGASQPLPQRMSIRLANEVKPSPTRTHFRWCRTEWKDGALWAHAMERCGSHMLSDFALSDTMAVIPAGRVSLRPGTEVEGIPLVP
ncbi:MAG: molybdopterin molybdotransferase MoeA [bacterium]|nr:molybdopterin molybdotransferase MoeA [bacterium]